MRKILILAALAAALAVSACKPAGSNNCKSGDTACDYTKGT